MGWFFSLPLHAQRAPLPRLLAQCWGTKGELHQLCISSKLLLLPITLCAGAAAPMGPLINMERR